MSDIGDVQKKRRYVLVVPQDHGYREACSHSREAAPLEHGLQLCGVVLEGWWSGWGVLQRLATISCAVFQPIRPVANTAAPLQSIAPVGGG